MRISDWSSDVCSSDLIPQSVAHPQKHVHSADRPGVNLADVVADFTARRALLQPLPYARDGRFIMAAIARIIDELGLVDDAVDLLMLAPEAALGFEKSVERRVGKESVSTCRSRCLPCHYKKTK